MKEGGSTRMKVSKMAKVSKEYMHPITIHIPDGLWKDLEELLERNRYGSKADIVRAALREFFQKKCRHCR